MDLLSFIIGAMFILLIVPFCDGFIGVIMSLFEVIKAKCGVAIAKSNRKIEGYPEKDIHITGFKPQEEEIVE